MLRNAGEEASRVYTTGKDVETYITFDGVQVYVSSLLHSSLQLCNNLCDGSYACLHVTKRFAMTSCSSRSRACTYARNWSSPPLEAAEACPSY